MNNQQPYINKKRAKVIRLGMSYDGAIIINIYHYDIVWADEAETGVDFLEGTHIYLSDGRLINYNDLSWSTRENNQ